MSEPSWRAASEKADRWLRSMMPEEDGSAGIWERIRIDQDEIVYRVRPDSTAEMVDHLLSSHDPEDHTRAGRMLDFLLSMQGADGLFPFYRYLPPVPEFRDAGTEAAVRFPNDNGKVLEILCDCLPVLDGSRHDAVAGTIRRLADALSEGQTREGWWELGGITYPGACFVTWPVMGLAKAYRVTGDEAHRHAVERGVERLSRLQLPNGRLRTSWESGRLEPWRPASSETVEAVRAFALAIELAAIRCDAELAAAAEAVRRWVHPSGAIVNCDVEGAGAALQRDPHLTDLVYTLPAALLGFGDAARVRPEGPYGAWARRLADFVVSIQCDEAGTAWRGGWRGSYDVQRGGWRGRANQMNAIDEGGLFSVYTGWTTLTFARGLRRLGA